LPFSPGELVVLLGAWGSGKSTLLNILGALDTATAGSLCFGHQALDLADDPLHPAEVLALVGLGDRLDHFPGQLSGGEQHAPIATMADRVVTLADGRVQSDRSVPTGASPQTIPRGSQPSSIC
jgi:ABC-type lipoprotein export system ATPase subunit